MARRKKRRSYHEPWRAARNIGPVVKPNVEGMPEEAAQQLLASYERCLDNSPWVVWGTDMWQPHIGHGLVDREQKYVNGDGVLFEVYAVRSQHENGPNQQDVSERVCECVNALAGVAEPVRFIEDVRALLLAYCNGECTCDPRQDPRILSLLCRCIPPESLKSLEIDHEAEG